MATTTAAQRADAALDKPVGNPRISDVGEDHWRVTWLRDGPNARGLSLDQGMESFNWTDDSVLGTALTGELNLREPEDETALFDMQPGDLVRCEHSRDRLHWERTWLMRVGGAQGDTTLQRTVSTGQRVISLQDGTARLRKTRTDYRYVADSRHPKGWTAKQVIEDVLRQAAFAVGKLPEMSTRIKRLHMRNASAMDVIYEVLQREKIDFDGDYVVRLDHNERLEIVERHPAPYLQVLGPALMEATIEQLEDWDFATSVTARCARKKDAVELRSGAHLLKRASLVDSVTKLRGVPDRDKASVTVTDKAAVKRYGLIHKTIHVANADSFQALLRAASNAVARRAMKFTTVSFDHPGIPQVRAQDAMKVKIIGEKGVSSRVVWVVQVDHAVEPGGYTMTVRLRMTDPFKSIRDQRAQKARAAAAKKRGRKVHPADAQANTGGATPPASAKAKQRTDKQAVKR